jgi:DNA mismatch repair protein MutS
MSKLIEKYVGLYHAYKNKYGPNTAIFMLVGSFYELYDILDLKTREPQTSAKQAVERMGITLTVKKGNGPKGADTLFAGFPEAQLHKFGHLLTRENWTVVVVDQKRDSKGAVEDREVARILSPGTHKEATSADTLYVGGLWLESCWTATTGPTFAASVLDVTTGESYTYEGATYGKKEAWSSDDLLHFFQVHPPRELIVWWNGHAIDQPSETVIKRATGLPTALVHVQQATSREQGGLEKELVREDLLRRCFKPKSLLPLRTVLGLTDKLLTERCLCSLLIFIQDHYAAAVTLLRPPRQWSPEHSVYLGNHALTQLNMITQREEDSVLGLFLKGATQMGRRAMRRRLLYPLTRASELQILYDEIDWCMKLPGKSREPIQESLRQIADLSRLHRMITLATVGSSEVLALDQSYHCAQKIAEALLASPLAVSEAEHQNFRKYLARFEEIFSIDKARRSSPNLFCLTQAAGPLCAEVEGEIQKAEAGIQAIHRELAEWAGMEMNVFRLEEKDSGIFVAASKAAITRVKSCLSGSVPETIVGIQIHTKKSASTLEIPRLSNLYFKIQALRQALVAAVQRELPPLCDSLNEDFSRVWDAVESWISRVDMSFTIRDVSEAHGFVRPTLVPGESHLAVQGLRHPLIESQQNRTEYVKHDVTLTPESAGWLVYGMNASGKSSLMKAVGIATILAQCGAYVPATAMTFSPFQSIFTRILNKDDLWAGLSSFAVEMTELSDILNRASRQSLVLGDEVCSGTESMSAMALVGASLEHLSKRGAKYIFATHLHGLQDVPSVAKLPGLSVWHLRVRHDLATDRLVYDRTLHPGAGSSLYGLEVAKAMAIPFDVLETAHAIRKALVGQKTEVEAPASAWNPALHRQACEICGDSVGLEVHHIEQRATAVEGRLQDGTSMNAVRNLVVVCEACHDKHHAKLLEIGPVQQTSEGPVRTIKNLSKYAHKPVGLPDEQLETIKAELRAFPNLSAKRMIFDLETRHGIKITAQRLTTIRGSL